MREDNQMGNLRMRVVSKKETIELYRNNSWIMSLGKTRGSGACKRAQPKADQRRVQEFMLQQNLYLLAQ
ncbi:hypothetical protein TNCV_1088721 [Trichonephila clavipes]|uniref:Uncharacterized protein n=1 Tax=Trichonephila clavipes TaxID=2585209 RepID=A0A8X6SPA0_TRICX|nr:hypothetical protein TNCV_1088721 [Trichonephila clavipes]